MPRTWTLADAEPGTNDWSSERYAGRQLTETVVIDEFQKEGMIETKITLVDTPVTVTSVGASIGTGGLLMYEFPQEHLRLAGAVGNLTWKIDPDSQANTVADLEGDFAIGDEVPADQDALGLDASDDSLGTSAATTGTDFAGSVSINSAVTSLVASNASPPNTPTNIALNAAIDAADITDGTSVTFLVSGTITAAWMSLGAN